MSDGAHAHPESFISKYVCSGDHTVIAVQYRLTGMVVGLVGGFLAYVIRMQLAEPTGSVPGYGTLNFVEYNAVVTMHGTIMIFWVAMPILLAAFSNLLIPLMLGADDMAFPKLNRLSYWTFLLSTVVLVSSFFVPGGAAAGGWTSYPPLSASAAYSGGHLGVTFWLLAVVLEFAAFLMGGINFIVTIINMRPRGMGFFELPIVIWMQFVAAIVFMLSVGPLLAGGIMLLLDRVVGTGFYDPAAGGDPILFQHLFWFFGHPEVYVIFLPGMGIIGEILPVFSRKPLFGYRMIVWASIATGVMSFIVWAHHQFIAGIDPRLATPFSITTIMISVPVAVMIFSYLATLWRGSIEFTTPMLFAVGTLVLFLLGGVTGIHLGTPATDIFLHDTYFVVAHFHYALIPPVFMAFFAGIYFWYPKMFGRMMNETLGKVHFWLTMIGINVIFQPQFALGFMGHQRRIANPLLFDSLNTVQAIELQWLSTIGVLILLPGQIPFLVAFVRGFFSGEEAGANPWRANTLEWVAPSPPPHGNFAEQPQVYRGPYEYSRPDREEDWFPQNLAS